MLHDLLRHVGNAESFWAETLEARVNTCDNVCV